MYMVACWCFHVYVYSYPNRKKRRDNTKLALLCFSRSPGFALLPQSTGHLANTTIKKDGAGGDASGIDQTCQFANSLIAQLQQTNCVPLEFPFTNGEVGVGNTSEVQLDLQRQLIQNQIEVL